MKCESAYLEQQDKDRLFGRKTGIEVKLFKMITINV